MKVSTELLNLVKTEVASVAESFLPTCAHLFGASIIYCFW